MTPEREPSVRVRIAVAVDPQGNWCASGWKVASEDAATREAMDVAVDAVEAGEARYWVEATLPIPVTRTVQADTTEAL